MFVYGVAIKKMIMMMMVDRRTPRLVDDHHRGHSVCRIGTFAYEEVMTSKVNKMLVIHSFCFGDILKKGAN